MKPVKKQKNPFEKATLTCVLNRMHGVDKQLVEGGEPLLAMKIGSIIKEVEILLRNTAIMELIE